VIDGGQIAARSLSIADRRPSVSTEIEETGSGFFSIFALYLHDNEFFEIRMERRRKAMVYKGSLRNLSKQQKIAIYNNRIVGANWLMLLIGILTAAELLGPEACGVLAIPGLSSFLFTAPSVRIPLSFALGLVLATGAVISMTGRAALLKLGFLLLGADAIFLGLRIMDASMPSVGYETVLALAFRMISLWIVFRAIRAVVLRKKLKAEMAEADRLYEEELKSGVSCYEDEDAPSDSNPGF
jgi:hypothetical protein